MHGILTSNRPALGNEDKSHCMPGVGLLDVLVTKGLFDLDSFYLSVSCMSRFCVTTGKSAYVHVLDYAKVGSRKIGGRLCG